CASLGKASFTKCTVHPSSSSLAAVLRPRERSTKNSGGNAADRFGGVTRQPVLVCYGLQRLPRPPEPHDSVDRHLGRLDNGRTPAKSGIDDDWSDVRILSQSQPGRTLIDVPRDVPQPMIDNLANWPLAVTGSYQFVIRIMQEDINTIGGYSTGCQAIR